MVMRINHNLQALNTYRQMGINSNGQSKSLAKLSSGLRINKAGDDAAGLAISEKMRGQIRGLNQASRNAEDAISMIQTAEGGLNEVHDILQRMRELSVQASNSTMETADRTAIGDELLELKEEIDRISDNTEFNGKSLLNGSLSTSVSSSSTILEGTLINTATTGIAISDLDVSGAAAATTYTLDVGATSGVIRLESTEGTQSITLTDGLEDNTPETLSFGELGISIEIVRVGTG
jgi:flagellin